MAVFALPRIHRQRKPSVPRVDSEFILSPRTHVYPFIAGSALNTARDIVGGVHPTALLGAVSHSVGRFGNEILPAGSQLGFTTPINPNGWTEITMISVFSFDSLGSGSKSLLRTEGGQGVALDLFPTIPDLRPLIKTDGTSGWSTSYDEAIVAPVTGEFYLYGCTYKTADRRTYFGRVGREPEIFTRTAITGSIVHDTSNITLCGVDRINEQVDGRIVYQVIANAVWPESLMRSLARNPMRLFQPRRILVPVAAGGDITVNPTAGTLTLQGNTAQVSLKRNVAVTAGTLTLSGNSATVSIGIDISPTAGTLTLSGNAATVSTKTNVAVTAGALALSGSAAQVAFKRNVAVTAGALTLTGVTATVTVGADTEISPTAGALTLAGAAAQVSRKTNIAPTAGTVTLTGVSAQVAFKRNIAPSAGTLTLAGVAATVEITSGISPTAGTLTLTGVSAQVSMKLNIAPSSGALSLSGVAASVTHVVPSAAVSTGGGPGWAGLMSQRAFRETTLGKKTIAKRRRRVREEIKEAEALQTPAEVRQEFRRVVQIAEGEDLRLRELRIRQAQALEAALERVSRAVAETPVVNDDEEAIAILMMSLEKDRALILDFAQTMRDTFER